MFLSYDIYFPVLSFIMSSKYLRVRNENNASKKSVF